MNQTNIIPNHVSETFIVSHIIERVDVYRGYQLKLKLNLSVEQFLSGLDCMPIVEMFYFCITSHYFNQFLFEEFPF